MLWVFFWVSLSIAVGFLAENKGRSGPGWFFLAILFSPLLAGLFALLAPPDQAAVATRAGRVPCQYCREFIRIGAVICPHCRKDVPAAARAESHSPPPDDWGSDDPLRALREQHERLRDKIATSKRDR